MGAHITSRDRGANALLAGFKEAAKGAELRVGILEAGSEPAEGSKDLTVADVATFNEFGLGVPERSFIRSWYDDNLDENRAALRRLQELVVRGEMSQAQAFEQLGLLFVGAIQRRIADGIPPPNAESTIKQKGSSTPLVDTGQLRASITHEVL